MKKLLEISTKLPVIISAACLLTAVFAYGDDNHVDQDSIVPEEINEQAVRDSVYTLINESYISVKPIFEKSCFDCHSTFTNYPWYYKIPGIKSLMDNHIEEAMEHLDLTNDFPFSGKGNRADILHEMKEELEEGEMPIMAYRIMHSGVKVEGEKLISVNKWIDASMLLLESIGETVQENDNDDHDHDHNHDDDDH